MSETRKGVTVALYPAGGYEPYQLYAPLPTACRYIPGHAFPRCAFRLKGRETLVITTEPEWRTLPGSANYVVVDKKRFGERITMFRLVRRHG